MDIRIEGIGDVLSSLEDLKQRARKLNGSHEVAFRNLFSPDFMKRNTRFTDFDEMLDHSEWSVEGPDDFEAIPDEAWDNFVDEVTRFSDWAEMRDAAVGAWAADRLEL